MVVYEQLLQAGWSEILFIVNWKETYLTIHSFSLNHGLPQLKNPSNPFSKGQERGISEACHPVFRVGRSWESWAKRAFEEQQRTLELSMWITSWCDPSQSSSLAMSRDVRPAELTLPQALFQLPAAWVTVLKSFMLLTSHCSWQICKWLNPYCW